MQKNVKKDQKILRKSTTLTVPPSGHRSLLQQNVPHLHTLPGNDSIFFKNTQVQFLFFLKVPYVDSQKTLKSKFSIGPIFFKEGLEFNNKNRLSGMLKYKITIYNL